MKHLFVVGKGEAPVMCLVFHNKEIRDNALAVVQRLKAGKHLPEDTFTLGLPHDARLPGLKDEWYAFLLTLPIGEEESAIETVIHFLTRLLKVSFKRQPDMSQKTAAAYTAAVMKHQ